MLRGNGAWTGGLRLRGQHDKAQSCQVFQQHVYMDDGVALAGPVKMEMGQKSAKQGPGGIARWIA